MCTVRPSAIASLAGTTFLLDGMRCDLRWRLGRGGEGEGGGGQVLAAFLSGTPTVFMSD